MPKSMHKTNGSLQLLRPLFASLTDAYRNVASHLSSFVSNPHEPVPELLRECALVCQATGFLAGQRFTEACLLIATALRNQPSSDGFRLLAAGVNAIGVHTRGLADGTGCSYNALNATYRRLIREWLSPVDDMFGKDMMFMPMFRTIDSDENWHAPADSSEEAFVGYLREHLQDAEDFDLERLGLFFRSLESRNSNRAVKVFLDCSLCILEMDELPETCLESIGLVLHGLAEGGYNGIDVNHTSRLLFYISRSDINTARARRLAQSILQELDSTVADAELAKKFAAALDKVRDILKSSAGSNTTDRLGSAAKQLNGGAEKLGSSVVTQLSAALTAACQLDPNARAPGGDESFWFNAALSIVIMRQAVDMAARGMAEDELMDITADITRRLADLSIPLTAPLVQPPMMERQSRTSAITTLCKEALKEIAVIKELIEGAIHRLDNGISAGEVAEGFGHRLIASLVIIEGTLETIGATKAAALARIGTQQANTFSSWESPISLMMITDIVSTVALGFERLIGSSKVNLDDLIIHEISSIAPEIVEGDSHEPTLGVDGDTAGAAAAPVSLSDVFLEEASAQIADIGGRMSQLTSDDLTWAQLMIQLLHSLRGGARVAGLNQIGSLASEGEEALVSWMEADAQSRIDGQIIHEAAIRTIPMLGALLQEEASASRRPDAIADLAAQVHGTFNALFAVSDEHISDDFGLLEPAGGETEMPLVDDIDLHAGAADEVITSKHDVTPEQDEFTAATDDSVDTSEALTASELASTQVDEVFASEPAHETAPVAEAPSDEMISADEPLATLEAEPVEEFVAPELEECSPSQAEALDGDLAEPTDEANAVVEVSAIEAEDGQEYASIVQAATIDEIVEPPVAEVLDPVNAQFEPEPTAAALDSDLFSDSSSGDDQGLIDEAPLEPGAGADLTEKIESLRTSIHDALTNEVDIADKLCDQGLVEVLSAEVDTLIPSMSASAQAWVAGHADAETIIDLRRAIHTLKGCVRIGGMLRVGSALHAMEDLLDSHEGSESHLLSKSSLAAIFSDALKVCGEEALETLDRARMGLAMQTGAKPQPMPVEVPATTDTEGEGRDNPQTPHEALLESAPIASVVSVAPSAPLAQAGLFPVPAPAHSNPEMMMRVSVSSVENISRDSGQATALQARSEEEFGMAARSVADLDEHVERARRLLKELEIQAEIRIQAGRSAEGGGAFDPIEFDRFTNLQEVTRSLAESINDISACGKELRLQVERLKDTETLRESVNSRIQEHASKLLLSSLSAYRARLERVIAMACTDTGKKASLLLSDDAQAPGPVLDRLLPSIEHILRNCIAHGIETPAVRAAKNKPPVGTVSISVQNTGARIAIIVSDDGGGIDTQKVLERALSKGLARADRALSDQQIIGLLFKPGFSTADSVSQLAGRGVGLDVVQHTVSEIGGTVSIASAIGNGTSFTLSVPSDISNMAVVPVTVGSSNFLIPANLVDRLTSLPPVGPDGAEAQFITLDGHEAPCPIVDMARLAGVTRKKRSPGASMAKFSSTLVIMGSNTGSPIAIRVDQVRPQVRVLAQPLSPLISSLPGIVAATVDGSGAACLVINPMRMSDLGQESAEAASTASLVMLVDDSSTVRMTTSQALRRDGFEVITAKDGIDAVEQLQRGVHPDAFIFDLEMPRMDGFELTKAVRGMHQFSATPIFVVSSRAALKHRQKVLSLGATEFLGKPVQTTELTSLIRSLKHRTSKAVT